MVKVSKDQMNRDEKRILADLQKNAYENLDAMAKRIGFSRQKIWRIMKKLEKNHMIWGYTTVTDNEKNELHHFTLLIKRSSRQLYEKSVDNITSRKLEEQVAEFGLTIESSYYVHGEYDWVITFTAPDLLQAKKMSDAVSALHPGVIEKTALLETLFFVKNHYILNPEPAKLKTLV
jgi:DNA-binding Lrp family transcriptional regulator